MTKKRAYSLICAILTLGILLQVAPAASAQSPASSQFEILGNIGGPTNAAAASGSYVYVGKGASVVVLEKSGGKLTQKGKQLNLPTFVTDLKVDGSTLYAADGAEGMYVIDISTPLEPVEIGVYKSVGYAEAVEVNGATAYLASGTEGLQIIDVSNPSNPQTLGQVYKGKHAFGVAVSGGNAYIAASNDGLLIADISESGAPKELGSYNTPGVARNVTVSGNLAYVADDWQGVCVVDISSPSKPIPVRAIPTAGRAHDVALDRNDLYVADAYMGLRVFDVSDLNAPKDLTSFIPAGSQLIRVVAENGRILCADQTNGILSFDASNPSALKLTGFYSHTIPIPLQMTPDAMEYDYRDSIGRLLVLGIISGNPDGSVKPWDNLSRAELAVVLCNVSKAGKAGSEAQQRFKDVPKTHWAFGYIEKAAQLGLVGGKGGGIYDPSGTVTNAEAITVMLRLVNRAPATGTWPANVMAECERLGLGTYVEGNADNTIRRGNIFAMLDKTVMQLPDGRTQMTLLQSRFGIELQNSPMNCVQTAVKGGYAYVTCGEGGLSVVDVSSPGNCLQVAHVDLPEAVGHIRIRGDYAYLPAKQHLYVLDVSDPMHPYCINSQAMAPSNGPPRGVDIDASTMYIADEWGFKIISLADLAKPVLIRHQQLMGEPAFDNWNSSSDIAVRDGIAYVSMEQAGTMLFDVTDANSPKHLGTYTGQDYGTFAGNISFIGNLGLSANGGIIDVLDIADIEHPKSIGRLDNISSSAFYNEVGAHGGLLFVPNGTSGVAVFDASSQSSIRRVGSIKTVGTTASITVAGSCAYVADGIGGMSVIALDAVRPAPRDRDSVVTPASTTAASFNTRVFAGDPAEAYVLSTDKALAVLNGERTSFSETLTVSNTNDSGPGSLRWCLENVKAGGRILFDASVFSPASPGTIRPKGPLEFPVGNITLDASNAGVIIDGSTAVTGSWGFSVDTDGNIIRGLTFQDYGGEALHINGDNNILGGNRLRGTGPNGEGNVIIRTGGIWVYGSGNIVVGNNVGVDADGVTRAGNVAGLSLRGSVSRNIIGIDVDGYRNVVSDTRERAISAMEGPYCNLIEGNLVGTDITGTKAIGNYSHGISMELCGYGNIIRNNVSCANGRNGVVIFDDGGSFNVVVGNALGIGADGKTLLPNVAGSVLIGGGTGVGFYNVLGDMESGLRNVTYDLQGRDLPVIPDIGLYETIVNGKVYKNADQISH